MYLLENNHRVLQTVIYCVDFLPQTFLQYCALPATDLSTVDFLPQTFLLWTSCHGPFYYEPFYCGLPAMDLSTVNPAGLEENI